MGTPNTTMRGAAASLIHMATFVVVIMATSEDTVIPEAMTEEVSLVTHLPADWHFAKKEDAALPPMPPIHRHHEEKKVAPKKPKLANVRENATKVATKVASSVAAKIAAKVAEEPMPPKSHDHHHVETPAEEIKQKKLKKALHAAHQAARKSHKVHKAVLHALKKSNKSKLREVRKLKHD